MSTARRLIWLDVARGGALIAMAVYHLCWDLELFGYLEAGSSSHGSLKWFARSIAGSFIAIAGFSLVVSAGGDIDWRGYRFRLAKICAAALLITIATFFATPQAFIYFGILHHIAVASLVGLAFVDRDWRIILAVAVASFLIGHTAGFAAFDTRYLAWTGLSEAPPRSNDFVPILPWIAAFLGGMAFARQWMQSRWATLDIPSGRSRPIAALVWLGRRSLAVYLLHQPILLALVFAFAQVFPADTGAGFMNSCVAECQLNADANTCERFCSCALELYDEARQDDTALPLGRQSSVDMGQIADQCRARIGNGER